MSRLRWILFVLPVFFIVLQGCNKKVAMTEIKNDKPASAVLQAPAPPPPVETIPSVRNPAQTPKQAAMGVPRKALQFQDAFFDYDQSQIVQEMKAKLEEDAKILIEHPEMKLSIEGHCDERGTTEYNLALGNRRAESVRKLLITLGVSPSQMAAVSYGKEKPFCSERSEACYRQNRRAHFAILNAPH